MKCPSKALMFTLAMSKIKKKKWSCALSSLFFFLKSKKGDNQKKPFGHSMNFIYQPFSTQVQCEKVKVKIVCVAWRGGHPLVVS